MGKSERRFDFLSCEPPFFKDHFKLFPIKKITKAVPSNDRNSSELLGPKTQTEASTSCFQHSKKNNFHHF